MRKSGLLRLPVVGVMGSGTSAQVELAHPLGRGLAGFPVHLLTGGGGGCMLEVARGFTSNKRRKGLSIGVIPAAHRDHPESSRPGYPNPYVELVIRTHLPLSGSRGREVLSRNHINILSSDVVIALPGGPGTLSEIDLAVQYGKPTICLVMPADTPALPDVVEIYRNLEEVFDRLNFHLQGMPLEESVP